MNPRQKKLLLLGGSGSSISSEYQAVLARATAIPTSNLPSPTQQTAQNRLIESLKRGGAGWSQAGINLFAEIELLYVPANDASDRVFGRINWINPGTYDSTEVGGNMTKVTNVGIFGTASIYATTGWRPFSDKVKVADNDLSMFAWVQDIVGAVAGVETNTSNRFFLYPGQFAVNTVRKLHSNYTDNGFHMINSNGLGNIYKFVKAVPVETSGSLSYPTLTDFVLPITGTNNAGTVTGRTTKVGIFGVGKKMYLSEVPLYSCLDEYMNGVWPINKTLTLDVTPTVVSSLDYFSFPNLIEFDGKYWRGYTEQATHNTGSVFYSVIEQSSDKGLTWTGKQRIFSSLSKRTITLVGTGTGVATIDGFTYAATFNGTLAQTANDFITAHAATLLTRNIIATSPSAGVIQIEQTNEATDINVSWNNSGGLGGTIIILLKCFSPGFGITNSGRFIAFISTSLAANSNRRFQRLKYSDDNGVTWSQSQEMTNDFNASNGQVGSEGNAITLANGDMLRAVYATVEDRNANPNATRQTYIYKCLAADNGLVWTQLSRITGNIITLSGTSGTANININGTNYLATFATDLTTSAANFVTTHGATLSGLGITVTAAAGVLTFTYTGAQRIITIANATGDLYGQFTFDFEEPTLCLLANGDVLITLRSDPFQSSYMAKSTDSGATWANYYYQSPSAGKNAIASNTDSSVIMTVGRYPGTTENYTARALVSISEDQGVTWRWRFVDDVAHWYMYAGLIFDSSDSNFVCLWARETMDDYEGPTNLILNKFS